MENLHYAGRNKMDVVCVMDIQHAQGLDERLAALEEVKSACTSVNANFQKVQFDKLDFGETESLDTFHNADVAVVDVSLQDQQSALFYQLGVRESFGMKENILIYFDNDSKQTLSLKVSFRLLIVFVCLPVGEERWAV